MLQKDVVCKYLLSNYIATYLSRTCSQDLYGPTPALKDFEALNKEIKNHIKKHRKDCSRVLPLTSESISIRDKLLCTIKERGNANGFRRVKNGLYQLLISYYSLEKCQDSVSKLPEANELKVQGRTLQFLYFQVTASPNSTREEVTRNNSTNYNKDTNGGTDNPKNGKVTTTPKPKDVTEVELTGNSTTDSSEDSGDSNDGTDIQENPTLMIAIVGAILFVLIVVCLLLYHFKYRSHGRYNVRVSGLESNVEKIEMVTLPT